MRKLGRGLLILAIAAALIVVMGELRRDAPQAPAPARPAGAPAERSEPEVAPPRLESRTSPPPSAIAVAPQRVAAAGLLEPPCVAGFLRAADGSPVAGALVTLFHERELFPGIAEQSPLLGSCSTDARGFFAVDAPRPGGGHSVCARATGHAPVQVRAIVIAADRPTLLEPLVLPDPCTLAGTVRGADGRPIAGARVVVEVGGDELLLNAEPEQVVHTDASGAWRATLLAPGVKDVRVRAPGHAFTGRGGVGARAAAAVEGVDFTLAPETQLRGRVTTPDGRGIAHARIDASSAASGSPVGSDFEPWGEGTSGADGAFVVHGLAAGEYVLQLAAEGFAPGEIEAAAGAVEIVAVLQPLASVSGRALAAEDGRPLAHFLVETAYGERLDVQEFTDPRGRFRVFVPPATRLVLRASASGRLPLEHEVLGEQDSTQPSELDLRLEQGPSVRGTLADAGSKPLGGLVLRLAPEAGDSMPLLGWRDAREPLGLSEATCDDRGRFVFEHVAPGSYRLESADPDVVLPLRRVVVGASHQTLAVILASATGALEVTLGDAAGAPAPFTVGRLVEITGLETSRFALSDEHGRFRIAGLFPGEYMVTLADAEGARELVQIEPGRVTTVMLVVSP